MTQLSHQLVMGLPSSGKTTFIAALWHELESREVPDSLQLAEVHGNRDHLNRIRKQWLDCQEIERTKITAERTVSFRLRTQAGDLTDLFVPDMSGETYRMQWESRQWTRQFQEHAARCQGSLLFVHPQNVVEPVRIDGLVGRIEAELMGLGEPEAPPVGEAAQETPPVEWTPAAAPTQVQLVELLQFLLRIPFRDRQMRLAVVISAWDLVNGTTPGKWLSDRLPLLDQFIESNSGRLPFRIFGVSAQGGAINEAARLQQLAIPSHRIRIVGEGCGPHDITGPIKWLMAL
jgi:hypothetical protein